MSTVLGDVQTRVEADLDTRHGSVLAQTLGIGRAVTATPGPLALDQPVQEHDDVALSVRVRGRQGPAVEFDALAVDPDGHFTRERRTLLDELVTDEPLDDRDQADRAGILGELAGVRRERVD